MALSIELVPNLRNYETELRATGHMRAVKPGGIVTFLSSTPDLDRHGTRILPLGIDIEAYKRNPVFLWGHDGYGGPLGGPSMDSVIGRSIEITIDKTGFYHDVEFAPTESGQQAKTLATGGWAPATSIGFNPRRWHEEPLVRADGSKGPPVIVFDEVELLEVSLVPIGSNPFTQALAVRALREAGFQTPILRGLRSEDHVEHWVRSEPLATQSEPEAAPETPATQREQDEPASTQRDSLMDVIRNLTVERESPRRFDELLKAVADIRSRRQWR